MDVLIPERCDFKPGDVIRGSDNSYRIEKNLGEGTFGIVYKVTDSYNQTRALKLLKLWEVLPELHKGLRERFIQEFRTGQIKSNYLVHSYTYGDVKNNPYFIMDFCPNGDLRAYVQKNHHVDFSRIGNDVLCGLRDIHKEGKAHRDLKPENVLLRQDYSAVLTDFGIAGDQNKRMTERGIAGKPKQVFGTYPYMPPEQVNPPRGGKATVLPTTDIFSFGVMMYEMMVGKLPFGELERDEQLVKYLENGKHGIWDRNALRNVDPTGQWTAIIERCLVPDYKMRVGSAVEVINMLPKSNGYRPGPQPNPEPDPDYMYVRQGILLRVMQGDDYGKVFKLNDFVKKQCRIITMGRHDESVANNIHITDNEVLVSRCHCTLEMIGPNQWLLLDGQSRMNCPYSLHQVGGCVNCKAYCTPEMKQRYGSSWMNSLNGTYLNSDEVDGIDGALIKPGDIITIGDVKLRVEGY